MATLQVSIVDFDVRGMKFIVSYHHSTVRDQLLDDIGTCIHLMPLLSSNFGDKFPDNITNFVFVDKTIISSYRFGDVFVMECIIEDFDQL